MAVVLVTGMSGTGKSSALTELARRGHRVVDTDYGDWIEQDSERLWREDRIDALLSKHDHGLLFVSGCVPNQGKFYPRFDAVVLLSAPADVIVGTGEDAWHERLRQDRRGARLDPGRPRRS